MRYKLGDIQLIFFYAINTSQTKSRTVLNFSYCRNLSNAKLRFFPSLIEKCILIHVKAEESTYTSES